MSLSEETVNTIVTRLQQALEQRQPMPPLSEEWDLSRDDAYAIQRRGIEQRCAKGARVTGKKIGLTSRALQEMLNVVQPDFGVLLDTMAYTDGQTLPVERLLQPRAEGEIAFLLETQLAGPGVSETDVLRATRGVLPAIEVIDSRIRDWNITFEDTVADNASSGVYVLGRTLHPVTGLDLGLVGMVLEKNGTVRETGAGAATLGHPAASVAWLANQLAEYDLTLDPGEVILSGALASAVAVEEGDHVEVRFDRLGRVSCRFG